MKIIVCLLLSCVVRLMQCGVNDFCPCMSQSCASFSAISNYLSAPSWSFLFEGNILNSGLESSINLSTILGTIVKVPERHGTVLYCNKVNGCLSPPVLMNLSALLCVQNLSRCSLGGYTISFWVKVGVNEQLRLDPNINENATYLINFPEQGIMFKHDHRSKMWQVASRYGGLKAYIDFSCGIVERWHQILAVVTIRREISAYCDGKLMGNNTLTSQSNLWLNYDTINIFSGLGGNPKYGRFWVDNFKMWEKPFKAEEVQKNFNDELED